MPWCYKNLQTSCSQLLGILFSFDHYLRLFFYFFIPVTLKWDYRCSLLSTGGTLPARLELLSEHPALLLHAGPDRATRALRVLQGPGQSERRPLAETRLPGQLRPLQWLQQLILRTCHSSLLRLIHIPRLFCICFKLNPWRDDHVSSVPFFVGFTLYSTQY